MIDDIALPPADDPPEPAPRVKQTEREPLHVIQARLAKESAAGLSGGKVRRGRQM